MQENFRAIVQGSDDAIIGKTIDGLVTSWNSGTTRIFGYTADESGARPNAASCNTTHARFVACGTPPFASST